jgi:hypothetical protein
MVIHYLHVQRAGRVIGPFKADAPLLINANRVLAFAVPLKRFKPVGVQRGQIAQAGGGIENSQPLFSL